MAGTNEQVTFILAAKDTASKIFNTMRGAIDAVRSRLPLLRAAAASLGPVFQRVFNGGISTLKNLISHVFSLKSLFLGFITIAGFNRISNEIDELGKTSKKLGIELQNLIALDFAANLGGAQGELIVGLRGLAKRMEDARNGSVEMEATFTSLGINLKQFEGRANELELVLSAIANKFKEMPDGAKKAALAQELLGRAGLALIPVLNDGAAGLVKVREEAAKLGITASADIAGEYEKFNDEITRITTAIKYLFINALGESVEKGRQKLERITQWIADNRQTLTVYIQTAMELFSVFFDFLVDRWNRYSQDYRKIWQDALAVLKFFTSAGLLALKTMLTVVAQAFVFTFQGIKREIVNSFKGFSLTDFIFKGDAYAAQAAVNEQIQGALTAVERAKEKLRLADLLALDPAYLSRNGFAKRASTVDEIREMFVQGRAELESASALYQAKMEEHGRLTPEAFGRGFESAFKEFTDRAKITLSNSASELGGIAITAMAETDTTKFFDRISSIVAGARERLREIATATQTSETDIASTVGMNPEVVRLAGENSANRFAKGMIDRFLKLKDQIAAITSTLGTEATSKVADWWDRIERNFEQINGASSLRSISDEAQIMSSNFTEASLSILSASTSIGAAVKNMVRSILTDLARLALSKLFTSLFAPLFPVNTPAAIPSPASAAGGGIFNGGLNNVPSFAGGGIAREPMLVQIGDNPERQEAVIPMKNGKVPVDLRGGAGGNQYHFHAHALSGEEAAAALLRHSKALAQALMVELAQSPNLRGQLKGVVG